MREVNIVELKKIQGKDRTLKVQSYKEEKANLIHEYLRLQDIVDEYNEKVNQVCCEIEQINIILHEMGEDN